MGENSAIRPVSREELAFCAELIRESFLTVAEEFGFTEENAPRFTAFSTTQQRLAQQMEEGRQMFAWHGEGRLLGFCALRTEEDVCKLSNLCVAPAARHRGIGEALVRYAFDRGADMGCRKVAIGIVEENLRLRRWYEQLGFCHTGSRRCERYPFTCGFMEKLL